MLRYREAYYEAFQVMIFNSTDRHKFSEVFNLEKLLRVPTVDVKLGNPNNDRSIDSDTITEEQIENIDI